MGRTLLGWQVRIRVEAEPRPGGCDPGEIEPPTVQRFVVAKWWGAAVGRVYLQYVSGPLAEDTGWGMYSLFVHPLFRGMGIGERLMQEQIAWAHKRGIGALRLYASERDAPSMALFHKLGFCRIQIPILEERLDREAGPAGRHLILMCKELEPTV